MIQTLTILKVGLCQLWPLKNDTCIIFYLFIDLFIYLFILKILAPSGSPEIGGEEGGRGDQDGEYM